MSSVKTMADVDYLLSGLRQELSAGVSRLQRADAADDHVRWYREQYEIHERRLRSALRAAGPGGIDVAYYALPPSWAGSGMS